MLNEVCSSCLSDCCKHLESQQRASKESASASNLLPLLLSAFTSRQTSLPEPCTYHRKRDTTQAYLRSMQQKKNKWAELEIGLWTLFVRVSLFTGETRVSWTSVRTSARFWGCSKILLAQPQKRNDLHVNTHEHSHKNHVLSGAATNDHFQCWWLWWLFFLSHRLFGELRGCFLRCSRWHPSMSCFSQPKNIHFTVTEEEINQNISTFKELEWENFDLFVLQKWLKLNL